jgi:hypothetical protein
MRKFLFRLLEKRYRWACPIYIFAITGVAALNLMTTHPSRGTLVWLWLNIPIVGFWSYLLGKGTGHLEELDQQLERLRQNSLELVKMRITTKFDN